MRSSDRLWGLCLLAVLPTVSACEAPHGEWHPMLEDTSSQSLRAEAQRAASAVEVALEQMGTDPEEAVKSLTVAEGSLKNLLEFFIPLHDARAHTYNAYRHFSLGEAASAIEELDRAEIDLKSIAQSGHGELLHEMEPPLKILEAARIAIGTDAAEAFELLASLATRLNNMAVKGELIVD